MIVGSEGDGGDLIYLCGILSELPPKSHALLLQRSDVTTLRSMDNVRKLFSLTQGLIASQPYIGDYRLEVSGENIDWKSGNFRSAGFHYMGFSLLESHVGHLKSSHRIGFGIRGVNKWLSVNPSHETRGMVVINRTSRYQNPFFQWGRIVEHYGSRIVFVGLPHEHKSFCSQFGNVSYRQTIDYLDVARMIAGSSLFIGNQSSPNALAEGLKHNLIQETHLHIPDCIFRRCNAQHVFNGACILPSVSGSGELEIPPQIAGKRFNAKTHMTPPGNWQYHGKKHTSFRAMVDVAWKMHPEIKTREEMEKLVLEENIGRIPDYFEDTSTRFIFDIFRRALSNAA